MNCKQEFIIVIFLFFLLVIEVCQEIEQQTHAQADKWLQHVETPIGNMPDFVWSYN